MKHSKHYIIACKWFDLHKSELHQALSTLAQTGIDNNCTKAAHEAVKDAITNYINAEYILKLEEINNDK